MAGEELQEVTLDRRGVQGDRLYAVRDLDGKVASCKHTRRFWRKDAVTGFAARTDASGRVWVAGHGRTLRGDDPALAAHLSAAFDHPVTVAEEDGVPHHDAAPVSFVGTATLEWFVETHGIDADPRRLRVNFVVVTSVPFEEEGWVGQQLRLGEAVVEVRERVVRCRTVDVAQDGVVPRVRWLDCLADERDLCVAMYAGVTRPGRVAVDSP